MSSSPSLVLSAEQRAWQYWFEDGLPTLVGGVGSLSLLTLDGALTLLRYLRSNPTAVASWGQD